MQVQVQRKSEIGILLALFPSPWLRLDCAHDHARRPVVAWAKGDQGDEIVAVQGSGSERDLIWVDHVVDCQWTIPIDQDPPGGSHTYAAMGAFKQETEEEEEEYEDLPQYVLCVPTEELCKAAVFVDNADATVEVYAVPGEDYEMCDDPRVFWTDEWCVHRGSWCAILELDPRKVYTVAVLPPIGFQGGNPMETEFVLRVSTKIPIQFEDMNSSDDEEEY